MADEQRLAGPEQTHSAITFLLGEEECAVPITDVHQIIRDTPVTKVPNVAPHVEGVLNLRGLLVPIMDLKHLLGLGVRELGERHRMVIAEQAGRMVGFSVDAVGGVFEFEEDKVQAAPKVVLAKVTDQYVRGVVRRDEGIVILLDTAEILKAKREGGAADASTGVTGRMVPHA